MRLPCTVVLGGLLYAADAPSIPIMSYYSFLNVSLHLKIPVFFQGGSTDPPCPYVVTLMVGTRTQNNMVALSPYDCHGLVLVCSTYTAKREHEKCLATTHFKRKAC